MPHAIFFSILLQLPLLTLGQDMLKVKHYGVDQGLPQSSVWDIIQDDYGFLWVSTADGLCRFDGYNFSTHRNNPEDSSSISGNSFHSMALDHDGDIWLTTDQGFDKYNSTNGKFTRLYQYDGLKSSVFNKTIGDDGKGNCWVWIEGEGLLKYDKKTNKLLSKFSLQGEDSWLNHQPSFDGLMDDNGIIWINQRGHTLLSFNSTTEKFRIVPIGMETRGLCQQGQATLLIGTHEGILRFNTMSGKYERIKIGTKSIANVVTAMIQATEDEFWLGTYQGIFVYNDRQRKFTKHYTSFSGSKENFMVIQTMFKDRSGNIWIGTNGDGLKKYSPSVPPWKHYKSDSDRGDIVKSIYANDDLVFVGYFQNGLDVFSKTNGFIRKIRKEEKPLFFPGENIYSIIGLNNAKLFLNLSPARSDVGIYDFQNQTFQNLTPKVLKEVGEQNMPSSFPSAGRYGKDSLLFNFRSALLLADFKNGTPNFTLLHEFENEIINSIFIDSDKTIWVGTMNGFYVSPFSKPLSLHTWKKGNPTLSKQIKTIAEDGYGNIWMGTPSGLYILSKTGDIETVWRIGQPLISDFVYGILRDNHEDMWFSHNKGLTRYDHKKKTFKNFSVDDGLQANEFNTGAYFKSASGELYFGGINGVNSFFPEDIKENTNIPSVQITRIEVNDKPYHSGFRSVGTQTEEVVDWAKKNITLDYTSNTLAFEFAGLEFTEPIKNQYASRLSDIDKDWVYSGNKRFTRYANIPPGHYTFEVKASNNDGVWNETPTILSITIVPPFWQTWWFMVLEFAMSIATIALVVSVVLRQRYKAKLQDLEIKHQVQLDRERISRELHDNIGTQLSQLSSTLDWAGKNSMSENEKQAIINNGLQTTREVISDLRESIWALKKTEILFTELADKLKTSIHGLSATGKIIPINFVEDLDSTTLTSEEALDLLRIAQEAVNNSLKHSCCTAIHISIRSSTKGYEIKIEDNGNGFEMNENHEGHYGLDNMKERAKLIDAQLIISSNKERGTQVVVFKGEKV